MSDLYLGRLFNSATQSVEKSSLLFETKNLTTHAVCVGMTGSGKTGLGIALLEEIGLNGIPAIIIDPKGDLGNLLLTFPNLAAGDFAPWIDSGEAERHGKTPQDYAVEVAANWKKGLADWDEDGAKIRQFKESVESVIYTPASRAGNSLSILNSFAAPSEELMSDAEALRERVLTTTSSLLGLVGIEADPINSREHILISTLLDKSWKNNQDLDLTQLIHQIARPPIENVGVLNLDTFYPEKERMALAMRLNNLLASPGFQAWMEGEPLNIQSLLYSKEGKPRFAIISIAHLSDAERMFFVTLLLNELISWMRRQSGTGSLRALLYMDEIFGYFPPTAMPPSKLPMLTLLKQARAYGLGVMLATQNPVDLDYKGLANCGTWFIGKLQTERDKMRVMEGLRSERGDSLDKMIGSLGKRVFILHSIHLPKPLLFQTRWALSYLRGPLTLTQIETLMKGKKEKMPEKKEAIKQKPQLPYGLEEFFLQNNESSTFKPELLGIAKLHFFDEKKEIDLWKEIALIAPVNEVGKPLWEEQSKLVDPKNIEKGFPEKGTFTAVPAAMLAIKNYSQFSKILLEHLYWSQFLEFFEFEKLNSKFGENEMEFRRRASSLVLKDKTSKLKSFYDGKMASLENKLQRANEKAEASKSQRWRRIFDAVVAMMTTIIGVFVGKGVTKGTIGQAGTTLRKAERMSKDQGTISQAEDSVNELEKNLEDLNEEKARSFAEIEKEFAPENLPLKKSTLRPRKSESAIQTIALIWVA